MKMHNHWREPKLNFWFVSVGFFLVAFNAVAQNRLAEPVGGWIAFNKNCMEMATVKSLVDSYGVVLIKFKCEVSKKGKATKFSIIDTSRGATAVCYTLMDSLAKMNWTPAKGKKVKKQQEFVLQLANAEAMALENKNAMDDTIQVATIKSVHFAPKNSLNSAVRYPGGEDAFLRFVMDNFVYPKRCQKANISGYVKLRFAVDKYGNPTTIKVIDGSKNCPEFNTEAIRIISISGPWIPGMINGKYVRSWRELPISITIN